MVQKNIKIREDLLGEPFLHLSKGGARDRAGLGLTIIIIVRVNHSCVRHRNSPSLFVEGPRQYLVVKDSGRQPAGHHQSRSGAQDLPST